MTAPTESGDGLADLRRHTDLSADIERAQWIPAFPVKRNPDGYVAQRILDAHPDGEHRGARGPWLLTHRDPGGNIAIQVLTDDEVADWAPLYDEISSDGAA